MRQAWTASVVATLLVSVPACRGDDVRPDRPAADASSTPWSKQGLVIAPDLTGGYDSLSDPCVLRDGSGWRAFMSRNDSIASKVGTATSVDGLSWELRPGFVLDVGTDDAWDAAGAEVPSVVLQDGRYRMWYSGWSETAPNWSIGYAESSTGTSFAKLDADLSPYGQTGLVLVPDVGPNWHEAAADPSVLLHGGELWMWFTSNESPGFVIALARSPDGIHWTWAGEPALVATLPWEQMAGPSGSVSGTVQPSVIFESGTFKMAYGVFLEAEVSYNLRAIGYAESEDGLHWTKTPEPIIEPGPETIFSGPSLVREGDSLVIYYPAWLADSPVPTTGIHRATKPSPL
jgi:predicted GH43/DUF377 family glycosyl hydrolase